MKLRCAGPSFFFAEIRFFEDFRAPENYRAVQPRREVILLDGWGRVGV